MIMIPRSARRIRLTTAQLVENLEGMDACYDAIAWVRSQPTPRAAWDACHRADWLIWIASRAGASDSALRVAACACARTALRHIPADEERPLRAIETAERFARGAASQNELDAARAAAWAATGAATGAARGATEAATGAAAWAATGGARGATGAARGAAAAAGAFEAAALAEMAALVRSAIPYEELVL